MSNSDESSDRVDTIQRSVIQSGLRSFDWVRAGNRMAVKGTRATLEGQAAVARQGTELTRQVLHSSLDASERVVPQSEVREQAIRDAVDEAMDAIDEATAESAAALADDLASAIETADTATAIQQNLLSSLAATVFDVELVEDDAEEPIRITIDETVAGD